MYWLVWNNMQTTDDFIVELEQDADARRHRHAQMPRKPWTENNWPEPRWMIDGLEVDFKDFVAIIFPSDSEDRTLFLLKYQNDYK